MTTTRDEFAEGWPVLAAGVLGVAVGVSSLYFYSLGVFLRPVAAEFGWSRGAASLGALVGTGGAALMAIPVGRMVDRFGGAKVALGSLVVLALSFAALGRFTHGLASFLVLTLVLSLATGSSPLPYTRLIVAAFERHRGVALGAVLAGSGSGGILVPLLLAPFVARHGWRAGYEILAVVIVGALPLVWLLLRRSREPGDVRAPAVPLARLAADVTFRFLAVVFLFASVAVLGCVVQFVPMLTDWGLKPVQAGGIAALIGVSAIAGRLIAGALLDRVAPLTVTAGLFLAAAAGLGGLALGGVGFAWAGALIIGLSVGGEADLIAFLVGRYFPKPAYGQIYGALYGVFLVGGALGPTLSGYLQQLSGDYRLSLCVAAGLLVAAGALALVLAARRPVPMVYDPGGSGSLTPSFASHGESRR